MIMRLVVKREFLILKDMKFLVSEQLTTNKRKKKVIFRDLTQKLKNAPTTRLI